MIRSTNRSVSKHYSKRKSKDEVFTAIVDFGRRLERQDIHNECVWLVWTERSKTRIFEAVFSNSARALLWVSDQMPVADFCGGKVAADGFDWFFVAKTAPDITYRVTLWGYDAKSQDPEIVTALYQFIYEQKKAENAN